MSKTDRNLKALGAVIKRLEEDSTFIDKLEGFISGKVNAIKTEGIPAVSFDVFEEFSKSGREGLLNKLSTLGDDILKAIIKEHGLDSRKLAQKWKSQERLIALILDRVEERAAKGNAFLNFKEKN